MKIENIIIDDQDEFDEETEIRKRFDDGEPATAKGVGDRPYRDEETERLLMRLRDFEVKSRNPETLPNYHYLDSLSDEHLPHLDFCRRDNFFGGKPAHKFYKNSGGRSSKNRHRLFGDFWLEGELAILFADTGAGKSILAAQLAQSLASGCPIEPFGSDAEPQRVAFFDLELSDDQFDRRYSNDDPERPAKFPFHRNFIRNPPNPDAELPEWAVNEPHFILNSIINFMKFSKARIAIIDNISWLNSGIHSSVSEPRFLRSLSRIRRELGISILVLAHTPKSSFRSRLSVNDLRGSKMIASFADSMFALGGSRLGPEVRYLKSIKKRSTPLTDSNKVATFRIEKDICFLGMKFERFSDERDHIGWMSSPLELERIALIERIAEFRKLELSQREIGRQLGVSAATVNRCLKEAAAE